MDEGARNASGPAPERGAPVTLRFDGRRVQAFEGQSVGAALHAAGHRVLMRSVKYHRPRGLFCMTGKCANCLMRVDGTPNVRACVTPVKDGMEVETQNAFPSARRDFFSIVDKVYRRNFDYHEKFIRPSFMVPIYHRIVRAMAGFGSIPDERPLPPRRPAIERREVDVLVVGAGPAGLSAAAAAAEGAADVLCVDESLHAGGSLRLEGEEGVAQAHALARRVTDAGGDVLTASVAFGVYRTDGLGDALPAPGLVAVLTPDRIVEVVPKALVVASGYHETPPLFVGNDLPGVMGARAARILLHAHGVLPGRRVVVANDTPLALAAAADLERAGATIVGRVGEGAWAGARVVGAHGAARVERVTLEADGTRWTEDADLVLSAGEETPRIELLQQAGAQLAPVGFAMTVDVKEGGATSAERVFATGDVLGLQPLEERLAQGARVGEAAARRARG